MGYLLVLLAATAAGAGIATFTLRQARTEIARQTAWSESSAEPATDAATSTPTATAPGLAAADPGAQDRGGGGSAGLPSAPTWQTRVSGIVGLLIAVLVAAGAVAAGFYALWSLLTRASRAFGTS